jgi:hypothetical protein
MAGVPKSERFQQGNSVGHLYYDWIDDCQLELQMLDTSDLSKRDVNVLNPVDIVVKSDDKRGIAGPLERL